MNKELAERIRNVPYDYRDEYYALLNQFSASIWAECTASIRSKGDTDYIENPYLDINSKTTDNKGR